MTFIYKNQVWKLFALLYGVVPIQHKWLFTTQQNLKVKLFNIKLEKLLKDSLKIKNQL